MTTVLHVLDTSLSKGFANLGVRFCRWMGYAISQSYASAEGWTLLSNRVTGQLNLCYCSNVL